MFLNIQNKALKMFIYYIFAQEIQSKIKFRKTDRFVKSVFLSFKIMKKNFVNLTMGGVFCVFLSPCFLLMPKIL